ncbi:MAG: ATP-binding cassette domain-containing protein [Pseudomonadales bacterium]|nr:ATP-binding cassette domain-containing protein [Pseudomonadales bacterium]
MTITLYCERSLYNRRFPLFVNPIMSLLRLRDITVSFGGPALLDHLSLTLNKGERVCLVGRNGSGKSTLLKTINREILPDEGLVETSGALTVARLEQEVPRGYQGSVFDLVAQGLGDMAPLIQQYQHLTTELAENYTEEALYKLEIVQKELEAKDGWALEQQVSQVLSLLSLDGEMKFESLSGGLKRRVLLAQALVKQPDILLLDEPTNHLDIESIQWLEAFLLNYSSSLLFISHDRSFIRSLSTRIIDLDRGKLSDWPGDYENYLRRKQEALDAEDKQNALFDKKLAQEEVWIRQGIKARRTRNEGRVRSLEALRKERSERRNQVGKVRLEVSTGEKSGQKVIEAKNISYQYGDNRLVKNFSTVITRKDRIGIVGPNGVGKSTLLKLLLGQLTPDKGEIKLGTNLQVAYFDQLRGQLDEKLSVRDNLGEGRDTVTINGRDKHVIGYLQDFLFSPDRANTPVKALSGGEKNRLLLAKLFARESNLLVLDEPTNDLDIETLDLLEELIADYPGTLLIVSHDRTFLNNVVTSVFAFEEHGIINEYVGGYDDWLRQRKIQTDAKAKAIQSSESAVKPSAANETKKKVKLNYNDQRELDSLPKKLQELEDKIGTSSPARRQKNPLRP